MADEGTPVAYENSKNERTGAEAGQFNLSADSSSERSLDANIHLKPWQWFLVTIIAICILGTTFMILFPNVVRSIFEMWLG